MKIMTMMLATLAGTVSAMVAAAAMAGSAPDWTLKASAAFVEAYVYACQPVEYDFAGARQDLTPAAAEVHDGLFLKGYAGSCGDFYFREVVQRLEVDNRPYFLFVGR